MMYNGPSASGVQADPARSTAVSPFEGMDIRTLIDGHAGRRPNHPFLLWAPDDGETQRWTYGDFQAALRRFAAGLHKRGVTPGDRVLIHLDNCPESLIAWLGCTYAGVVPVTTNTRSTADDLDYFAAHSRAVGVVTQPRYAPLIAGITGSRLGWFVATATDQGVEPAEAPAGFEPFGAIDGNPADLPVRAHDPHAHFGIQYTSGTTARPKAVLWSHANALWGARSCAATEDLRVDDVHLTHLPLFHTNAQVYSVLASLWAGSTILLVPRFSASRFWDVSIRHDATWTSMIPFCAKALLTRDRPRQHRYRFWGNAVCDAPWDTVFGIRSIGWWGMTETIAHGTTGSVHLPDAPMSIGRPAFGYGIHVLDDDGRPVAPGETGDLFIKGERGLSLFVEYADDPAATAAAFTDDGLFITGDRVRLGEEGHLFFADRSKDMLKIGGENVAASEIEQVIAGVPGVAEVAVVAKPHAMLDEVPVAFVIALPDATDVLDRIRDVCESKLAAFKRPQEVRLVDALPRSTLEKVAKAELRALLTA